MINALVSSCVGGHKLLCQATVGESALVLPDLDSGLGKGVSMKSLLCLATIAKAKAARSPLASVGEEGFSLKPPLQRF